jgi:YD repeat-containing protein
MSPTTTIIIAALALALATEALAQSRTYYDKGGNVTGKSSTDSQGTTTFYDARGNVTGRTSKASGLPPCDRASGVCYPK